MGFCNQCDGSGGHDDGCAFSPTKYDNNPTKPDSLNISIGKYKTIKGFDVTITSKNPNGGWNGNLYRDGETFWCWWSDIGDTYNAENNLIGCDHPTLNIYGAKEMKQQAAVKLNTLNWLLEEEKKIENTINSLRIVLGTFRAETDKTYNFLEGYLAAIKTVLRHND
jgi:hypothetical protein